MEIGLKNAAPRMRPATLSRTTRRQLKPLASPGLRFGLLDGGVEFGESDMINDEVPKAERLRSGRAVGWGRVGVSENTVRK